MMKREKKNSERTKKRKIKEIKRKKKIIKEESELEKEIENTEEKIEETGFREFLQPIDIPAPVLKRVQTPAQEPLETELASAPATKKEEETGIDYVARNEPRYATATTTDKLDERKYESEFRPPVLRQIDSNRFREEFLMPSREIGIEDTGDTERIETGRIEQKRREPFERQEEKYREVKFR